MTFNAKMLIRLSAPPVEGKANRALIAFLAKTLGVSKANIQIRSGEKGRDKLVLVEGLGEGEALAILKGKAKRTTT